MKILDYNIKVEHDVDRIRKQDVRPWTGWPNGIDPYPWACDKDVVSEVRRDSRVEAELTVVGWAGKLGDKLDWPECPCELYVTEWCLTNRKVDKGTFGCVTILKAAGYQPHPHTPPPQRQNPGPPAQPV